MKTRALVAIPLLFACYSQPEQPPPVAPVQQQGWAAQPPPGQPGGWPPQGAATDWYCTALASAAARGSLCFAQPERCESERRQADADGARSAPCRPQSPVACFQLGGDPNPSMEMCAASVEDCELWRLIDQDKNGRTGTACEWRHAPGLPR